jgi:hypothetical protein
LLPRSQRPVIELVVAVEGVTAAPHWTHSTKRPTPQPEVEIMELTFDGTPERMPGWQIPLRSPHTCAASVKANMPGRRARPPHNAPATSY